MAPPPSRSAAAIPGWDLMALNDYALHWPASAELIAMPAPGLFS